MAWPCRVPARRITVTLVADQLRTGGGTLYTKFFNNPAGGPVSTATWDWNSGTGVLTQTGGVYYATRRIGSIDGRPDP